MRKGCREMQDTSGVHVMAWRLMRSRALNRARQGSVTRIPIGAPTSLGEMSFHGFTIGCGWSCSSAWTWCFAVQVARPCRLRSLRGLTFASWSRRQTRIPQSRRDLKIKQVKMMKHTPDRSLVQLPECWHLLGFCHSKSRFPVLFCIVFSVKGKTPGARRKRCNTLIARNGYGMGLDRTK
ncbi:MAG: hypothetical protein JWO80_6024 [Bryobacterales bacterium]|nr:hypothetical protein [Bryobacterales bacterium]